MDRNQLPGSAHGNDNESRRDTSVYMTTEQSARYLCRSVSWLLRQKDIPYLPGKPNLYSRRDLDDWFERSKRRPLM